MTQTDAILEHLRYRGPLTPLEALKSYGCLRLGARVHELKKLGHVIETRMVRQNGKCFAEYRLA